MKIGFAGLSHLGVISSLVAAAKGCNVTAYGDSSELKKINSNKINISEPKLNNFYLKYKKKIKFTNQINDLKNSDIIYISKDVVTDDEGNSDLTAIRKIIKKISLFKVKKTLVIISQVPPGFTRKITWPKINLYYQVETLVFGNAIGRASQPERIIIGCLNPTKETNSKLKKYLNFFKCPIIKMKYESAELAKISINMYLISSITITNLLSQICNVTGAKWSEISPSIKLDKRIGKYAYLNPGLGISGGNLERDLKTITKICNMKKIDPSLFKLWENKSNYYRHWALRKFNDICKKKKISKIALLGLSYKANTDSIKNSPGVMVLNKLKNKYKIKTYDPVVKKLDNLNVDFTSSSIEALKGSEVLMVMTPWKEFSSLSIDTIKKFMKGNIIIDPYGAINLKNLSISKFNYFSLRS